MTNLLFLYINLFAKLSICLLPPPEKVDPFPTEVCVDQQVFIVDTIHNPFQKEKTGIRFRNREDTLMWNRALKWEPDRKEDGPEQALFSIWDPEETLFLVNNDDEIRRQVETLLPAAVLNTLIQKKAYNEIYILVDSTGRTIECEQFLTMEHFVWDDELLPFLAAIDSFVKKTVLYEDNGRLQQAGVPYGRTRIHLYFKADGIEIKNRKISQFKLNLRDNMHLLYTDNYYGKQTPQTIRPPINR